MLCASSYRAVTCPARKSNTSEELWNLRLPYSILAPSVKQIGKIKGFPQVTRPYALWYGAGFSPWSISLLVVLSLEHLSPRSSPLGAPLSAESSTRSLALHEDLVSTERFSPRSSFLLSVVLSTELASPRSSFLEAPLSAENSPSPSCEKVILT
jgi:hypothetical protein